MRKKKRLLNGGGGGGWGLPKKIEGKVGVEQNSEIEKWIGIFAN